MATWWVVSAKREETRAKRAAQLVEYSRRGERLPHLVSPAKAKKNSKKAAPASRRKTDSAR